MKQLKIDIPEGYEIDKDKSTFENIVFKKIERRYPTRVSVIDRPYFINNCGEVNDYRNIQDINHVSSEERAKTFLALMQLVELRDAWNKIDGFVVDWANDSEFKYCIIVIGNEIRTIIRTEARCHLYFGSFKTRDKFLETFKDLIEQAKELL